MNKTLTRKLIYVVAALTLLAMLIPAMAVPVSAAAPTLSMVLVDPTNTANTLGTDNGYNIYNSIVQVNSNQSPVTFDLSPATGVASVIASGADWARIKGTTGNIVITATNSGNETSQGLNKKFGLIDKTSITAPGTAYITWNQVAQVWELTTPVRITDTVYGVFDGVPLIPPTVMQGAILNWYLLPASMVIDLSSEEFLNHGPSDSIVGLKTRFQGYLDSANKVQQVSFAPWGATALRYWQNVSNASGQNYVDLYAKGPEAVKIVCIAEYPGDPQKPLTPEMTSYTFYTTQASKSIQVRWAGEKIVLEKYFGPTFDGMAVKFALESPTVGSLYGISANATSDATSLWTPVTAGFASCILESTNQGLSIVHAGLYNKQNGTQLGANIDFYTAFLKFESLTISDVFGKRAGHNTGLWEISPAVGTGYPVTNPWDASQDWGTTVRPDSQTLNVSQDALVRARIKGWYTDLDPGVRDARKVNLNDTSIPGDASGATLTLPYGRHVLPDDWADLAGQNMIWDIMCNPYGPAEAKWVGAPLDGANDELGNYYFYNGLVKSTVMVGNDDVIGPFSPGIELMTPAGWEIVNAPCWDPLRNMHTVVPDGEMKIQNAANKLNKWDAPMPPAKIVYQIQSNTNARYQAGYFKPANKTDIYYTWVPNPDANIKVPIKVYTNPFYQEMIPAHEAIPAFVGYDTHYDWDSFNSSYGAYIFWEFIMQSEISPLVSTWDADSHPTMAVVYSDNHGEAMVWLNGDWNLNLTDFANDKGSADVPFGAVVGKTYVKAFADYPYARGLHQRFYSNLDEKTWTWGGLILGGDYHRYGNLVDTIINRTYRMVLAAGNYDPDTIVGTTKPYQEAKSPDRVVFAWVTDRDGLNYGVNGATVRWDLQNAVGSHVKISDKWTGPAGSNMGISQYNEITRDIYLANGFLLGTDGAIIGDLGTRQSASSKLRTPTTSEKALFNKFWGSGYTDPVSHNHTAATAPKVDLEGNPLNPNNFLVAAIDLIDPADTGAGVYGACDVYFTVYSDDFDPYYAHEVVFHSSVEYHCNVDFFYTDPLDDAIRPGDANCDGVVNMGDVTAVERMILGYNTVTSNAVLNSEGTVDMGTVVKIERTILGLK